MKEFIIKNPNEFYTKLSSYKNFWYKNTEFKSDIKDRDLQAIIKALNIKKRNKRIEYIYDYAIQYIDEFYANKNICKFKNNKCLMQQGKDAKLSFNGCCRVCALQTKDGCKTQNLTCKLFFCDKVRKECKTLKFKDIKIFKLLSLRQRIMILDNYFATKEEFLIDLKSGLLIVFFIGLLKRIFRNAICERKTYKEIVKYNLEKENVKNEKE